MTAQSIAVRLILISATLTTVATSAPRNYVVEGTATRTLSAGTWRIHALGNQIGVAHADELTLRLELRAPAGGNQVAQVTITADGGVFPTERVSLGSERTYDLIALCDRDRDCDAAVTLQIPTGATVEVTATASLIRFGDSSLFFPDDRSFPSGAAASVRIEP
jgi:hypothetical protein